MFLILVVLYKKELKDSETLQSLINSKNKIENSLVIVWDNSPNIMFESDQKSLSNHFSKFKYIHTPENYSLSKIYNITAKKYLNDYKYLVLFDHDSEFESTFFIN